MIFSILAVSSFLIIIQLNLSQNEKVQLTLLHINDLHGWLNPHDGFGGVATYMEYFRKEGFDPSEKDSSFLLFSGGDHNTGPAIATLSKGEAVIDVMNAMGFCAAAIGNHEFDYGVEWLMEGQNNSDFPLLSCNIYDVGTTDLANFSIPWVIQNHAGINVGIIGLTTITTYYSAHPKYTQYFDFGDYETALRKYVPVVRQAGADIIIALTHISYGSLSSLAQQVTDLKIAAFLGGHSGFGIENIGSSIVAVAGHYASQYAKIIISIDITNKKVISSSGVLIDNVEGNVESDPYIQSIVDSWEETIAAAEVITFTSEDIHSGSGIEVLVPNGFIYDFNYTYNIGLVNYGFPDYFRKGSISVADIVSVLPFENNLLAFNLTGQELQAIYHDRFEYIPHSGIRNNNGILQIQEEGIFTDINLSKTYNGLIADYLWYISFQEDFSTIGTGVHYRDAVITYFRQLDDLAKYTDPNHDLLPLSQIQHQLNHHSTYDLVIELKSCIIKHHRVDREKLVQRISPQTQY